MVHKSAMNNHFFTERMGGLGYCPQDGVGGATIVHCSASRDDIGGQSIVATVATSIMLCFTVTSSRASSSTL